MGCGIHAKPGDPAIGTGRSRQRTHRKALNDLRLEMGNQLGLRTYDDFKFLWVMDFPIIGMGRRR